jgi:hypothetical protein
MYNEFMPIRSIRSLIFLAIIAIGTSITDAQTSKKSRPKPRRNHQRIVVIAGPDHAYIEREILAGKFLHDDIGALIHVGTIELVPALLRVLDYYNLDANCSMICTRAHALTALYKITGQHLGSTYEAWSAWWDANKDILLKDKK